MRVEAGSAICGAGSSWEQYAVPSWLLYVLACENCNEEQSGVTSIFCFFTEMSKKQECWWRILFASRSLLSS